MSEGGRVAAIFAAVAVLGGGAGYYFFKVYQPAQQKKAAQDEITAWETRWKAARDCLLGPSPASSKTSEALAIREMSPDPWEKGTCTPLISKLNRGGSEATSIDAVETAWAEVDKAAGKAAQAFALHVSAPPKHDPLAAALDRLDESRRALRAAAGLPPDAAAGKPLPAAQAIALADGTDPVTSLSFDALASAHGMVLFGKTASHEVQVDLFPGAAPKVGAIAAGSLRGMPDDTWGATAGQGQVNTGGIDDKGAMPAPSPVALAGAKDVSVFAAGGSLAEGVVVYGADRMLAVAHAHQSAITADSPLQNVVNGVYAVDGDGRVAVVWLTAEREQHARILKPGGDEPLVQLTDVVTPGLKATTPMGMPTLGGPPCLTADRAWVRINNLLVSFGGGKPAAKIEQPGTLLGCTQTSAVVATDEGYALCSDTCHPLARPAEAEAIAVVGDEIIGFTQHGGVLAVHRTGKPVAYYGLPEAMELNLPRWLAMTSEASIDLLAQGEKGLSVVRIPAK